MPKVIVVLLSGWIAAGVWVAVLFQVFRLHRFSPEARLGSIPFRIFITPGLVLLWPLVAWKWTQAVRAGASKGSDAEALEAEIEDQLRELQGERPLEVSRPERSAHSKVWWVLPVLLVALLAWAWSHRQSYERTELPAAAAEDD